MITDNRGMDDEWLRAGAGVCGPTTVSGKWFNGNQYNIFKGNWGLFGERKDRERMEFYARVTQFV